MYPHTDSAKVAHETMDAVNLIFCERHYNHAFVIFSLSVFIGWSIILVALLRREAQYTGHRGGHVACPYRRVAHAGFGVKTHPFVCSLHRHTPQGLRPCYLHLAGSGDSRCCVSHLYVGILASVATLSILFIGFP